MVMMRRLHSFCFYSTTQQISLGFMPRAPRSPHPLSDQPVLNSVLGAARATSDPAAAQRWYRQYCDVVVGASLRLWLCYGVTLELHGQNTLLALDETGTLQSLICREVAGGAYCFEPLLQANSFDLRQKLHPRQDAVFATDDLPMAILLHAVFCQHLLPLADAVQSLVAGVSQADLIELLRTAVADTLRLCADEHPPRLLPEEAHQAIFRQTLARTEHALLLSPTVRAKSLLLMRALGSKLEIFVDAQNPLARCTCNGSDARGTSRAHPLGRLEAFPLNWRPWTEVAGVKAR